jgi:crotonobetainyl-CoA:carnitine CoA-transferase CaiB-like acyl-CoA transferase
MPEKQGSAHPNIAPYGEVFRTADNKEVLLAVGTDGQFQALCKILDIGPGTVQRFQTNALRVLNRRSLTDLLSEKIGAQPLTSFQTVLQAENIPYGLIRNMKEVFESDNAANLLLSGDGRTGVKTYVGSNSLTDFSHFLPPPRYGQHTEEVLMQSLEMDLDEVKRLKSSRIIL